MTIQVRETSPLNASFRSGGGAAICLVGRFLIITGLNAPLNHQLDRVIDGDTGSSEVRRNDLARWQPWNHVRTITTLLSSVFYAIGALKNGGSLSIATPILGRAGKRATLPMLRFQS